MEVAPEDVSGDDVIDSITVSTNTEGAGALAVDDVSVWESNGAAGTHWIQLNILPKVKVQEIVVVAKTRDSYKPAKLKIEVGNDRES